MEKEIEIPGSAEIEIDGLRVKVKGPKGGLEKDFSDPRVAGLIAVEKTDKIVVRTGSGKRKAGAMTGTIAAHIRNMLLGVTEGFMYEMKVVYTHFPVTVSESRGVVEIKNFFGEKGVRRARVAGDTKVKVEKDKIVLTGADIEHVGQTAANIEAACRLRRRDRRVFQDGIYITKRALESGQEL